MGTLPAGQVETIGEYLPPALAPERIQGVLERGSSPVGGVGQTSATFAFGMQCVEVRVHRWTRAIRVPRLHGAFAAGNILNRKTSLSQLTGAMVRASPRRCTNAPR